MNRKVIGLTGNAQVVECDPEELSGKVVEELIDVLQRVERQKDASNGSKADYWVYRVPFAGARYYFYV